MSRMRNLSRTGVVLCVGWLLLVCAVPVVAQQPAVASSSASSAAVVPPLVSFNGILTDVNGKPLTDVAGVTFALYKDAQGGAPLWLETQNVYPDKTGRYTVLLGSTTSSGLPPDLFVAGEARWLGVQVQGQAEQPRVSLLSVPYALKAADAQTVGGLPASAFVLAAPPNVNAASAANASAAVQPMATGTTPVTTAGGTVNKLTKFDATADITSSQIFDNGTNVGIGNTAPGAKLEVSGSEIVRGLLYLPSKGTATATAAYTSQPIKLTASVFNSGTGTAVPQNFQWQAEPVGNNTAATSGTLNLLYATGSNALAETGLKISSKGLFTFATGQTFPGTGTITGITTATGSGLQGGGNTGTLNLGLLTTCTSGQLLKWNGTGWACAADLNSGGTVTSVATGTGLTGGPITTKGTLSINTAVVPQLKANNSFTGTQTIIGSLGINTATPSQSLDVSSGNAIVRGAGNFKATGNTAFLYVGDTSHPIEAIWNTGLAIGAYKVPTALFIQDGTGNVGIGTTTPSYALDVHGTANFTGLVNFASGQTFPGTVTSVGLTAPSTDFVVTGSPVTSSGTLGLGWLVAPDFNNTPNAIVKRDSSGNFSAGTINAATSFNLGGTPFAFGSNATYNSNVFLGFAGNTTMTGTGNTGVSFALVNNTTGNNNTAIGPNALVNNTTGSGNTAVGPYALANNTADINSAFGNGSLADNTTGTGNTAVGFKSLWADTTGSENTGVGEAAFWNNSTGSYLTCIGYQCTTLADGLSNATAIGAHAVVSQSNSLVLGGTGDWGVKVGIGTTTPSNILTIGLGLGHPVSDSWETYSSRRWKTNIQTLHGALGKVEQLRGVSYDLKANGKHEVGVIAEEVGAVVPEVVTWEKNGKDAQSVDYGRLTALLIEAVKQQQREIRDLKSELRATRQTLQKVKAQVDSTQPTLGAAK